MSPKNQRWREADTYALLDARVGPGARQFEFGDEHECVLHGEEGKEAVVLTHVRTLLLHRRRAPLLAVDAARAADVTGSLARDRI